MSKEEYVQLHTILAKLKYIIEKAIVNECDYECTKKLLEQSKAIDEVMKIFTMECD